MDKNRELHELLGKCWHETSVGYNRGWAYVRCSCGKQYHVPNDAMHENPDYVADPRLVLREMDQWDKLHQTPPDFRFDSSLTAEYGLIPISYLINDDGSFEQTGKLAEAATEFLRKEKWLVGM